MNEKNIFIVRCGEVALKGQNKPYFEKLMVSRIRKLLSRYESTDVYRHEGLIFVKADKKYDADDIIGDIGKVFGVASISPALECESDLDAIGECACGFMKRLIRERGIKTFKISAKRADKDFPVKSPEIARIIGAKVLIGCRVLKVDVHHPDCELFIDLRKDVSYVFEKKISGFGGLPLGSNGKGMLLLSGGIDSPVAGFMMARRGMLIEAVHFHSYPYTSQRAREKALELARELAVYVGRYKMHIINLLPVQEEIVSNCPEEETTIHVRCFMMKIAERLAEDSGCRFLITGEDLGQVASQTADALAVTDRSVNMPVMRPLIAMDKAEIIEKAKAIGTYETSIMPYEDCCTVFLPRHPLTRPRPERIESSQSRLDVDGLISRAIESQEIVDIKP